jgi:hypothetical protein
LAWILLSALECATIQEFQSLSPEKKSQMLPDIQKTRIGPGENISTNVAWQFLLICRDIIIYYFGVRGLFLFSTGKIAADRRLHVWTLYGPLLAIAATIIIFYFYLSNLGFNPLDTGLHQINN